MSLRLGSTVIAGIGTNTKYNANNLLDWKWSDHELSDQSWLNADTFSWQDGTTYSDAYNHLVADMTLGAGAELKTETIGSYTVSYYLASDGHKIVMPDQETIVSNIYNESGVAWYYILDTTNQRFKLPRENPEREVLGQSAAVIGNGIAIGLTDGTTNYGLRGFSSSYKWNESHTAAYGTDVGTALGGTTQGNAPNKSLGVTTDPTKSGIVAQLSETTGVYKGKKYLYFYVGEYSQTATEQTAGLNAELFNGKADADLNNVPSSKGILTESYVNGASWYRVYSDGWCEQGGRTQCASTNSQTLALLKAFANTNYSVQTIVDISGNTGGYNADAFIGSKTTSEVTIYCKNGSGGALGTSYYFYWQACGYVN